MAIADKYLRRPAVEELTGLSRSTIYDLMAKGAFARFIKPIAKAVAWRASEIIKWLSEREPSTA